MALSYFFLYLFLFFSILLSLFKTSRTWYVFESLRDCDYNSFIMFFFYFAVWRSCWIGTIPNMLSNFYYRLWSRVSFSADSFCASPIRLFFVESSSISPYISRPVFSFIFRSSFSCRLCISLESPTDFHSSKSFKPTLTLSANYPGGGKR